MRSDGDAQIDQRWNAILEAVIAVQSLLPATTMIGGSAVTAHTGHRFAIGKGEFRWSSSFGARGDAREKTRKLRGRGAMPAQAWVTLVVGGIGFAGVIGGIVQKTYSDKRAEWWRRATWAVDHTLSDDIDAQVVGFDVLEKLQTSKLATRLDRDLFEAWGTARLLPDDTGAEVVDNAKKEDR